MRFNLADYLLILIVLQRIFDRHVVSEFVVLHALILFVGDSLAHA